MEQAALVEPVQVPAVLNWPVPQAAQAVQTRVAVSPYWLAGHVETQVVPWRKVPEGQLTQLDSVAAVHVAQLAWHATHWFSPVSLNVPAGQVDTHVPEDVRANGAVHEVQLEAKAEVTHVAHDAWHAWHVPVVLTVHCPARNWPAGQDNTQGAQLEDPVLAE